MSHPSIFWAQTKESVYMRLQVNQAENINVDIQEKAFSFSCVSHGQQYACNFTLFKEIDIQESKYKNLVQAVEVLLKKKEAEKEFWPSLQDGPKLPYVRVDFDRWIDEDEDEKPAQKIPDLGGFGGQDFGGFDPSQFKMPEGGEEDAGEGCGCDDEHCGCNGEGKCEGECGEGCKCGNEGRCCRDGGECCHKDGACDEAPQDEEKHE